MTEREIRHACQLMRAMHATRPDGLGDAEASLLLRLATDVELGLMPYDPIRHAPGKGGDVYFMLDAEREPLTPTEQAERDRAEDDGNRQKDAEVEEQRHLDTLFDDMVAHTRATYQPTF